VSDTGGGSQGPAVAGRVGAIAAFLLAGSCGKSVTTSSCLTPGRVCNGQPQPTRIGKYGGLKQKARSVRAPGRRQLERGMHAVHRDESRAGARPTRRLAPATSTAPSRPRAGWQPFQCGTAATGGTVRPDGTPRSRARPRSPRAPRRPVPAGRGPPASHEETCGTACCVGCGKRRVNRPEQDRGPPSTIGNASRPQRSASPSPRYAASSGFGRSRGRYASRSDPDHECIERARRAPPAGAAPRAAAPRRGAIDGGPQKRGRNRELGS